MAILLLFALGFFAFSSGRIVISSTALDQAHDEAQGEWITLPEPLGLDQVTKIFWCSYLGDGSHAAQCMGPGATTRFQFYPGNPRNIRVTQGENGTSYVAVCRHYIRNFWSAQDSYLYVACKSEEERNSGARTYETVFRLHQTNKVQVVQPEGHATQPAAYLHDSEPLAPQPLGSLPFSSGVIEPSVGDIGRPWIIIAAGGFALMVLTLVLVVWRQRSSNAKNMFLLKVDEEEQDVVDVEERRRQNNAILMQLGRGASADYYANTN